MENSKSNYSQSVQAKIKNKRLDSYQFRKIANKILNRGTPSVMTIIDGPEVTLSLSDKAKLFATKVILHVTPTSLCDIYHRTETFQTHQKL